MTTQTGAAFIYIIQGFHTHIYIQIYIYMLVYVHLQGFNRPFSKYCGGEGYSEMKI